MSIHAVCTVAHRGIGTKLIGTILRFASVPLKKIVGCVGQARGQQVRGGGPSLQDAISRGDVADADLPARHARANDVERAGRERRARQRPAGGALTPRRHTRNLISAFMHE